MRLWANLGLSLGEVQNVPSGQGTSWPEYFLRQTYVPKAPNSSPICMILLERSADLLPRIASQSYFESMRSVLAVRTCERHGRPARLESVNHLMTCAAS